MSRFCTFLKTKRSFWIAIDSIALVQDKMYDAKPGFVTSGAVITLKTGQELPLPEYNVEAAMAIILAADRATE